VDTSCDVEIYPIEPRPSNEEIRERVEIAAKFIRPEPSPTKEDA
jgi:hypothetical protein